MNPTQLIFYPVDLSFKKSHVFVLYKTTPYHSTNSRNTHVVHLIYMARIALHYHI